jgi:hypothetical protein
LAVVRLPCADGQFETSQVPVQATVSSEPVKMQADAHPEGIIHLDVAATDREGKPFSGLAAKDFTLTDNGVGREAIRTWMLGSGCPGSRLLSTTASGWPAFAQYRPAQEGGHRAWALIVLDLPIRAQQA